MFRHAQGTVAVLALLAVCSAPALAVPGEHAEIALGKDPAVVRQAAAKALPDAKWSKAFKSTEEGETIFELLGADPKGRELEIELTPGGRVLEIETGIPIEDVPLLVRDVLKSKAKDVKVDRARTVTRDSKLVGYSFKGKSAKGQAIEVRISPDGNAVVAVAALLFSFQTKLIFPGAATQGQPSAIVRPRPGEELVTLTTAQGDRVMALFAPALRQDGVRDPESAQRPTLLYFYGNGQCLRDTDDEFQQFRRVGLNVLIPEYVGYGMSGGSAGEAGCFATADAAYEHLRPRKDVDPSRVVAAGWSLGGAVAIDLACRRPVAGLIALSSFTSMTDMAHRNFPFLPARLLLRHKFDNAAKIARVDCPILLAHGRRDAWIPFPMSDRLAERAKSNVTRLTIETAGHNDFYAVGDERVFDAVRRFIAALPPAR